MSSNNDNYDDVPSIVPEKDELVSHRKRKRGTAPASAGYTPEVVVGGTSGFVIFLLTLLFFGLCATGGAGYYFYMQGEEAKGDLLNATNRISQLENRLNQVDEATEQSSLGLLERVDFNFSEIDKLWAARNALRTEVGELKALVTTVQELSKGLETAVASHTTTLNDNRNLVVSIQARIEQINRNFAGMDNLGEQLTLLNADLNRVKTAMTSVQSDVETRLSDTEQNIESINVYRLQLNQTISALQTSLNRLQERVGQ